jgi:hypothetical protein
MGVPKTIGDNQSHRWHRLQNVSTFGFEERASNCIQIVAPALFSDS